MLTRFRGLLSRHALNHDQSAQGWKLPPWLDHFNSHDLKTLFRCWVASWVALLLTFIHPALVNIGQATFFCALVLFIVPPASIVFVYLLASFSLLFGMCLAWAWGLLTMKAALAARPEAETSAKVQALQQQAAINAQQTGQSVAWETQILVNNGFMLDTRVTVVFYVMASIFIYALARLRCTNPKFMLTQLFGSIVTNIFLLFGPTLPAFNASVASVLVKPGAIGIGIGVTCCLCIFPRSTSYTVLNSMTRLVSSMELSIDAIRKQLNKERLPPANLLRSKAKMLGMYKAMQPAVGFLPLDISRGLCSADDLKHLLEPIREAMMAGFSLIDSHIAWAEIAQKEEDLKLHNLHNEKNDEQSTEVGEQQSRGPGHRELTESAHLMEALRSPESASTDHDVPYQLERTTKEVLSASSRAIQLIARTLQTVNDCRWFKNPTQQAFDELRSELDTMLGELHAARTACVADTTEAVLEAFPEIFDENGNLIASWGVGSPRIRGIIFAMVVEERILVAAKTIEKVLMFLSQLLQTRRECRMWFPAQLSYAIAWLLHAKNAVPSSGAFADATDDPDDLETSDSFSKEAKDSYRRIHTKRLYVNPRRRQNSLSRFIVRIYHWLSNPAGLFALRMVVVTIATAIPSAVSHSAGFFYREKGIWAVITAQTTMVVYMADFTQSLLSRAVGTVFGGVLGLVSWYIGSGNGPGNPYGMAAITAVVILIILWLRIFLPPTFAKGTILSGATFVLVVGFSYDQGHIVQYGLPGKGYEAFWKRLVTVLIGFLVATLVQIFPKPPSATKHVCKTLSRSIGTLSSHYALLLSHWAQKDNNGLLGSIAEDISIEVAETLLSLNDIIATLQFEMTTGPFDQKALRQTQLHCQAMNQSLRRLLDLSASLPDYLQHRLARTFGLLDDQMIGDVMAVLNILQQSLITASPLPERLPTPLIRRFYASWEAQHRKAALSKALVRDENYRRYCVAMSSYLGFLSSIDDLVLLMKMTLGENHVVTYSDNV